MSIHSALRDATTGHIKLDQAPIEGWIASAILKRIISDRLHEGKEYTLTSGRESSPIDAIVGLSLVCENELRRFHIDLTSA